MTGNCSTLKMTDQITGLGFTRPGKWRTSHNPELDTARYNTSTVNNKLVDSESVVGWKYGALRKSAICRTMHASRHVSTGMTTVRTPDCNFYAPSATAWARTLMHSSLPTTMTTTPPRRHPLPLSPSPQRLQQLLQTATMCDVCLMAPRSGVALVRLFL